MRNVKVNSRSFDGTIKRSWDGEIVAANRTLTVLVGEFSETVSHPVLGTIQKGTVSYEYYWADKWYNVFRFHEPDGEFRNWYCNLNMPPTVEKGLIDYVDLEIDILIWPGEKPLILDENEFDDLARRNGLSKAILDSVSTAKSEILTMYGRNDFPFDQVNGSPVLVES